jgi:hypothetical protein
MKKFFGRDKPKRAIEEDTRSPPLSRTLFPAPGLHLSPRFHYQQSRLNRSAREILDCHARNNLVAAVGILRALDPHIEVAHPGITTDDRASQYEPSIRDDKKDWKLFWERKERKGMVKEGEIVTEGDERTMDRQN